MGSFMQMGASQKSVLRRAASQSAQLDDFQRQGMLKAMLEEMEGDLATAKSDEATSVKGFEDLSAAKAAEISSATSAIEAKTKRAGEVAVEVVQTKDDLEDTEEEVKETEAFLG